MATSEQEQHIAVFGQSGSGKTVLLSAFYGAAKEPGFGGQHSYDLFSTDGNGLRLHQNYLGMKASSRLPGATRRRATTYSFRLEPSKILGQAKTKSKDLRYIELVWHDYPGEWLEGATSGPEEESRRIETFRALLRSDVALLLVDGQRLRDNNGGEERYLKTLFAAMRNELGRLKNDLLSDGPLEGFPRVWIIALSKSDLLPELDAYGFRDLVIEKAAGEIVELRDEIKGLVTANGAVAVGDEFILLSSGRFCDDGIDLADQVGVPLLVPVATILPLHKIAAWHRKKLLPAKIAERMLTHAPMLVGPAIDAALKHPLAAHLPHSIRKVIKREGAALVEKCLEVSADALRELNDQARHDGNGAAAMLASLQLELIQGIESRRLLMDGS